MDFKKLIKTYLKTLIPYTVLTAALMVLGYIDVWSGSRNRIITLISISLLGTLILMLCRPAFQNFRRMSSGSFKKSRNEERGLAILHGCCCFLLYFDCVSRGHLNENSGVFLPIEGLKNDWRDLYAFHDWNFLWSNCHQMSLCFS